MSTLSPNLDSNRCYVLNTRPILNFLGCGRTDIVSAVLGPHVYISPSVLNEVRRYVKVAAKSLQARTRQRGAFVDPNEIRFVENLRRGISQMTASTLKRVSSVELKELELLKTIKDRGSLDAGESEILAIAMNRGWTIVIDEWAGHSYAEQLGVANECTLSVIVKAVNTGILDVEEGKQLWADMRSCWDYAPVYPLLYYLSGKPVWSR